MFSLLISISLWAWSEGCRWNTWRKNYKQIHFDSDELVLVKIPILSTVILNTGKRKDLLPGRVGSIWQAMGNWMGVEREQKGCPSFGVYFGGGMSLWGQREQEIRVRKLPFDLWPEVFILKRRGREFGRDFHMVKTSISHPLFMFFFLCNRSLKCQRHQCTQVKKLHFPVSLAVWSGQWDLGGWVQL